MSSLSEQIAPLVQPMVDALPQVYRKVADELSGLSENSYFRETMRDLRGLRVTEAWEGVIKTQGLPWRPERVSLPFGYLRQVLYSDVLPVAVVGCYVPTDQSFPYPSNYRNALRAVNPSQQLDWLTPPRPFDDGQLVVAFLTFCGTPPALGPLYLGIPEPIALAWSGDLIPLHPAVPPTEQVPEKLPVQTKSLPKQDGLLR